VNGSQNKKAGNSVYLMVAMSCGGVLSLMPATRLLAADTEQPSDVPALEEITVTAQRRAENLQAVPIVVDTVSASDAAARGATNIQSLFTTIPNLTFTTASNSTNTYIRGVGDNSASVNNEPSTAVYVDGVYNAQAQALTSFNFNNIQQIEVLKGPQGTLFGRNSTAGVIQIITPDPKQELSGRLDVGYANYDTVKADAYLTGGLTDKISGDLSVLYLNQTGGFGTDLTTGTPTFLQKDEAVRSKWLFNVSDATKIHFVADYANFDSGGASDQFVPQSAGLGNHGPYAGPWNVYGQPFVNDNIQYGAALTLDQDIGSMLHFVSITSYRWVSGYQNIDSDFTALPINEIIQHYDSHYVTQEFHLLNQNPGWLSWLVGAYYYGNEVWGSDPRIQYGTGVAGGYREYIGDQNVASGSVFGQATGDIGWSNKLTLGVRYTDETIKAFSNTRDRTDAIIAGPYNQEIRSDPVTWRVALDHQFDQDIMGYISYNKGFKSGGYNLSSPGSAPFFPEHVDAYEIGMKSEFFDHRVRLNIAGFYYKYRDIQVAVVLGGNQLFENAAAARNFGMDESLDFVATENLTFSTGIGLLNAKYLDYPNARGYTPAGVAFPIANAKGADLPFAPPETGFVSVNYHDLKTSVGKFGATVSASYNDRSYVTPDEGLERPTNFNLDATLQWRPLFDETWSVQLWGKNLTNALSFGFSSESSTGWYVSYNPPRQYGITIAKEFK
jgi:iron complex outermembrane recepter protein